VKIIIGEKCCRKNNRNGLFSLTIKAGFIYFDKNGDVNLEIPVRGDLNDPKINIWRIVWTTFKRELQEQQLILLILLSW
jgi:hypothetical protein